MSMGTPWTPRDTSPAHPMSRKLCEKLVLMMPTMRSSSGSHCSCMCSMLQSPSGGVQSTCMPEKEMGLW